MFFNSRKGWTIDSEKSEMIFKRKYLILTGVDDVLCCSHDNYFNEQYQHTAASNNNLKMHIKSVEFFYPVNYTLVVFGNKNNRKLLNEKFLAALLTVENAGKALLVNLKRTGMPLNNRGTQAFYSVEGKICTDDWETPMRNSWWENNCVLKSEILFTGQIHLVQKK